MHIQLPQKPKLVVSNKGSETPEPLKIHKFSRHLEMIKISSGEIKENSIEIARHTRDEIIEQTDEVLAEVLLALSFDVVSHYQHLLEKYDKYHNFLDLLLFAIPALANRLDSNRVPPDSYPYMPRKLDLKEIRELFISGMLQMPLNPQGDCETDDLDHWNIMRVDFGTNKNLIVHAIERVRAKIKRNKKLTRE